MTITILFRNILEPLVWAKMILQLVLENYFKTSMNNIAVNTYCITVWSAQIRSFFWSAFPLFRLNTKRYSVSHRIPSECAKMRTWKKPVFGYFSRSVYCNETGQSNACSNETELNIAAKLQNLVGNKVRKRKWNKNKITKKL